MKRTLAALLLISVGATANVAVARDNGDSGSKAEGGTAVEEASQRFQRGVKLYRDRSFDAALVEFNRAYELSPDYRVLYNIGQVQVERGDSVAAVKAFRQYLKEGGDAISATRSADLQTEITRLEGRIAKLHVAGNVDGAELVIDGDPAGILPMADVSVNAGVRRVIVRKKGYEPAEQRLMLAGGEDKTISLQLKKSTGSPAGNAGQLDPTKSGSGAGASGSAWHPSTGFWVSLAATVVAGGATVGFGLATRDAKEKFEAELNRFPGSRDQIDSTRSTMKRDALITDGCAILTAVGVGATIYFAATGSPTPAKEKKVGAVQIHTGPTDMGRSGAGWQIAGQF